jgi:enoyl-[acyl-carrier protein] reductase II
MAMTTATRSLLHTPLCDLLGIRYPICQAGMGYVARAGLAAAVSGAGGLGVLAAAHNSPAELREEIRRVREATDKPFGVDVLFATVRAAGEEVDRFTDAVRGSIDVTLEERVPVLIAGLGNPGPVTAEAHRLGMKVMALCGNVKQARDHAASGVDVVIAQGHEAGGHTGRIAGLVLIPAVVDAVAPAPVVAAGGIADGRGLVAALALGAVGVWLGTRFIATAEAWAHDNYKNKIVALDEEGTVVSRASSGKPCRLIRNNFTRDWEKRPEEIQPFPVQYERVGRPASVQARERGDIENGSAACGQSAGLIHGVRPVGEVLEAMMDEARAVLARLPRWPPRRGRRRERRG